MKYFNVPGAAWVALITFLMGFVQQYFPGWEYAGVAITVLAIILKAIEVAGKPPVLVTPPLPVIEEGQPLPRGIVLEGETTEAVEVPHNKVMRVLLG